MSDLYARKWVRGIAYANAASGRNLSRQLPRSVLFEFHGDARLMWRFQIALVRSQHRHPDPHVGAEAADDLVEAFEQGWCSLPWQPMFGTDAGIGAAVYAGGGFDDPEVILRHARLYQAFVGPVGCEFGPYLGDTSLALARAIYADRAFDRMPILADALQDAGYPDTQVLDELRSGDPTFGHRGYVVLDAILGKRLLKTYYRR